MFVDLWTVYIWFTFIGYWVGLCDWIYMLDVWIYCVCTGYILDTYDMYDIQVKEQRWMELPCLFD